MLTQRQETFCLNIFSGMTQREAYINAYNAKYAISTIDANASRMAKNSKVIARYEELKKAAASDKVMTRQERQERLSEIARANLIDFMELGKDGSWVNLGAETPNTAAIQEIHSRTEYDKDSEKSTVHTSVKLHSPLQAIDLLNKMDKIYNEGTTVNVDNRKVEIIVSSEKSKELMERLLLGERTNAEGS